MNPSDRAFVIGLLVVAAAIPAVIITVHLAGFGFSAALTARWIIGSICGAIAGIIAILNVLVSVVRPLVHLVRHGSLEQLQHVSPLPGIGSVSVLAAALILPSNAVAGTTLLLVYFLDTGGIPWAAFFFSFDLFRREENQNENR